jgi:hypothetical protein
MKKTLPRFTRHLGAVLVLAITALAAHADVTMQLDRSDIGSDETAELTVNASGGSPSVPTVPGLQFTAVSQSSQIEIINGNASSTSSITYEITPQGPGTYTIPSPDPNAAKLTLRVHNGPGAGSSSAPQVTATPMTSASPAQALPTPTIPGATQDAPKMVANGAAFMRMQMPKRDLYVGENVPIDIQIGLRSGMAASLNGLPTLSADAFTLNKLTDKPEETEEVINGQPYTILTWHSLLAAVKPGDFSLAVQSPVTVQVRTRAPRMPGDMGDMFNDPFFQGFFGGGVTQKELALSTEPSAIKVLPLPLNGQPSNFSGAVGNFTASSELSASSGTVGDPLTLRLKISGSGAFDRVESPMLGTIDGWKTYRPTGKFVPADSIGYSGEKDFEQAMIPQQAGHQTVPPITFSYFNPETSRYEELHTIAINVEVQPGSAPTVAAATPSPATQPATNPRAPAIGMRPDMTESGVAIRTLRPLYFQHGFLVAQAALALAFIGSGFWLRRANQLASNPALLKRREELKAVDSFLNKMDSAASQQDAATFFFSARQALQHALASRWKMTPGAITLAEIEKHSPHPDENLRQVFALADEFAYSGNAAVDPDYPAWKQTVRHLIHHTETI